MPKENSKEPKRAPYEEPQQNKTSDAPTYLAKLTENILQSFFGQHSKAFNQSEEQLKQIKCDFERMQAFQNSRNAHIEDFKKFVDKKMEVISKVRENFNQVINDTQNLANDLKDQKNKCNQTFIEQENKISALTMENQKLEAAKEDCNTIIMAKEAECAAYLTEMKASLEKAASREKQLEDNLYELQAKVKSLEAKVQDQEKAAEANKDAFDGLQAKFQKKTKKLLKKNKNLRETMEQLQKLKVDYKELEEKFEIQGCKMRELQSVLDRPYRHVSCISSQEQIAEISPLTAEVEPSGQMASTASTDVLVNTQLSNNNNANDDVRILRPRNIRTAQRSHTDDILSDIDIDVNNSDDSSTEEETAQNRSTLLKRSSVESTSEDFDFPPYVQSGNMNQTTNSNMDRKRFKRN